MTLDPLNVTIVALLLVAAFLIEQADKRDLFATWFFRLRIRYSKRVPVGWHRVAPTGSCGVGKPDTVLVFKLTLLSPGGEPSGTYVGVTDTNTRMTIDGATVAPDDFLEAYDDEAGALSIEVYEVGKLAVIGIDTSERPPSPPDETMQHEIR